MERCGRFALAVLVCAAVLVALPQAAGAWTAAGLSVKVEREDRFWTYDFESARAVTDNTDWPVTIVFWGHATVSKVKAALRSSLPIWGIDEYACVSDQRRRKHHPFVWVSDTGVKTFNLSKALHMRLYADPDGYLTNATWGDYVIATTHFDFDELGTNPTSGRSEEAAAAIEAICVSVWGADAMQADVLPLFNVEPDRVEQRSNSKGGLDSHYWQCDGFASMVEVP
jgi:hypothetical protein